MKRRLTDYLPAPIRRMFGVTWKDIDNPALWGLFSSMTRAGVNVTPELAVQISTVYGCVRFLEKSLASVPLHLIRRAGASTYKATDQRLYGLLHDRPNPLQSSYAWRSNGVGVMALRGAWVSYIERDLLGRVIAIWPLHPGRVRGYMADTRTRRFEYRAPDGQQHDFADDQILYIPWSSDDCLNGKGPIQTAPQVFGRVVAAEQYADDFWRNDATPTGILKTDLTLGETVEQSRAMKDAARQQWIELTTGENRHKPVVLDRGLSWQSIGVTPEQAQILQTRGFGVIEICRMFGVPPHKVADMSRATWGNIEHLGIESVVDTLLPLAVSAEQEMNAKLLTEEERGEFFVKFNLGGLMRGDQKSRYESYGRGILDGWLTRNEAREWEDLNPLPGLDEPLQPLNMTPAGSAPSDTPRTNQSGSGAVLAGAVNGSRIAILNGNGAHHDA